MMNLMKKSLYLLLMLLVVATMACNRNPKPVAHKPASDYAAADMVALEHGRMQFYNAEKQTLIAYEKETDSVVNVVFDEHNHLYYTVKNDQGLELRKLDLDEKDPLPIKVADWNLTLDEVKDHLSNTVSHLVLDEEQKHVMIWSYIDMESFFFDKVVACDVTTGQLNPLYEGEMWDLSFNHDVTADMNFYSDKEHHLFFVDAQGKHCLNDQIDFSEVYSEDEMADMECVPFAASPDLKRVAYSSIVYWGEGWGYYCVSDCDGSNQRLLELTDIWTQRPEWLPDGSLAYIIHQPLDVTELDYDDIDTEDDVMILTPDGQFKRLLESGNFAVKPFGIYQSQSSIDIAGSDMVVLDNGKMVFYNSDTDVFTPFEAEKDSVTIGLFNKEVGDIDDNSFYYTVAVGDALYLKNLPLDGKHPHPTMITEWDLKVEDCISQTYGDFAPMYLYPNTGCFGINYHFNWDFYSFDKTRYYDAGNMELKEDMLEELETDSYDEAFLTWDEDMEHFDFKDGLYYYKNQGKNHCLSDKIDFAQFTSEPELNPYEMDYNFISIDPTRKSVIFTTILEWGDLGHGPLCFASLDGTVQLALEDTDAANVKVGWLRDGSLVYVGLEARPTDDPDYDEEYNNTKPCIKRVSPDGTVSFFSHASDFVVRNH